MGVVCGFCFEVIEEGYGVGLESADFYCRVICFRIMSVRVGVKIFGFYVLGC